MCERLNISDRDQFWANEQIRDFQGQFYFSWYADNYPVPESGAVHHRWRVMDGPYKLIRFPHADNLTPKDKTNV